jgi:hypothetical protein
MTSKIFGSIVALVLACSSAAAADIRRVVTALDAHDKAIVLFDSRVTLEPGATPSAKLWVTDTAPATLSFTDDSAAKPTALPPDLGTALLVVEFPPLIVQQATNHAWINRGTQPCRILFALIDSRQP